ncbi:response regulator transcription factor [Mariprofundus erugo]|nr:response regulator transcription factor [Mariprofundus erugo]
MTIHIQVMNEQNLIREGIVCLLHMDPDMAVLPPARCDNGCNQTCYQSGCDIIVVGTHTGSAGSLHCLSQIVRRFAEARVLLIIRKEQASLTGEAIRIGAKGVVSLDIPGHILRKAVRTIAEGGSFIEPWLAQTISETPYRHTSNPFDSLSPREQAVLHMILSGANSGCIAENLHISQKTVANHHTHIMSKLGVKNMVELLRMAMRHNLIQAFN